MYRLEITIILQIQPNELGVVLLAIPASVNSIQGAILINKFIEIVIWRPPTSHFASVI